jgi:DHA1 family bicyclomycin/chloramphenicol resistance-like MFS transporter
MTANRREPLDPAKAAFRRSVLLLGAIAALGSLSTQLLVPALPSIAADLGIGVRSAQLVIGVFLVGLGGGQLLVGPIADRVERRHLLLGGLALFAAGSLLAAFSNRLEILLAARLLQAAGSATGLVIARVLLNTMVPPERAVAAQASLMSIVLVSPALAPVLGGVLTEWMGWRAIMGLLFASGLIACWVVSLRIPREASRRDPAASVKLHAAYGRIIRNRRFLAATAAMACGSAVLYVFLGAAPFLLEGPYGLSPRETGLCLLLVATASIAGTKIVGRVQPFVDPLRLGTGLSLLAVLLLGGVSLRGDPSLALFLAPCTILGLSAGFIGPTAIAHILVSAKGLEGTSTSLAGALQMTTSALAAWLAGSFAAQGAFNLALALAPISVIGLTSAMLVRPPRA